MAVTSAAVRTVTAGVHRHWLLEPIGPNDNQCKVALRSLTAYCDGVQRQRNDLISTCPSSQEDVPGDSLGAALEPVDSEEEEAEEEDVDNRSNIIQQYFQ
ncbi:hypothetical protein NDU88_003626 [Pleurodeles waltl]|uniref:Uncharacterized protein n=1 Tax=Pleurodeles waltl TaxID=8319 RepID=A0AAV7LJ20_PLEWA|nr:hypothetical protein NDU88_003626 [Pleurodeles waltl]